MSVFITLIVVADGLPLAGRSLWRVIRVIILRVCLSVWLSMRLYLSVRLTVCWVTIPLLEL